MPKVLSEYREQAKKRILEAACKEFTRKGYRETSLSDIAKSIGVSKSALYGYFRSKDELLWAVGISVIDDLLSKEFSRTKTQGLVEIVEGTFERTTGSMPSWFADLMCDFLTQAHRNKRARELVRRIDLKLVRAISGFLEECRKSGEISPDVDNEAIIRGLVALHLGLMAFVSSGIPRSEAVRAWTEVVEWLGRGLGSGTGQAVSTVTRSSRRTKKR